MFIRHILCIFAMLLMLPLSSLAADYVIGEGDGLDIAVWGVKELTFPVKVRPDGKITVPGLGDVQASGLTPTDLQAALSVRLKELVKNPIVTVTVNLITNSKVYIFGGGVKAGVFELHQRSSLLQLLCTLGEVKTADLQRAYLLRNGKKVKQDFHRLFISGDTSDDVVLESGGFTKFADQNSVLIRRKDAKDGETIEIKAKKLLKDGDLTQNVVLKAGDYIVVRESLF